MKMMANVLTTGAFVRFRETLIIAVTTAATQTTRTLWRSAANAAMQAAGQHS